MLTINKRQKQKKHIVALGPASANHGEAKMFNHSCDYLKKKLSVEVIDSVRFSNKFLRPVINIVFCTYYLIQQRPSHLYLSYSRNKLMLFSLFVVILPIIKVYKIKCIYHIHDTSLRDELKGALGKIVRILYLNCVTVTVIPNNTLVRYSLLHPNMQFEFLLNPYLGELLDHSIQPKSCFSFISYPSPNKNLDQVIKLMQSQDKQLEVIGWSETDVRKIYPKLIIDKDKISFYGALTHSQTMKRLSGSSGLISVSAREAMPLNIIEALLLKVPVYVVRRTGYPYFMNTFSSVYDIQQLETKKKHDMENPLEESRQKAQILFDISRYNVELFRLFE